MTSIDAIINRQLLRWELAKKQAEEAPAAKPPPPNVVTISRQAGSQGTHFASLLADRLGYQRLHREAIDAICESSGYRKRMVESLDEKFRGDLELMVESFFTGQSVDHADYHRHLFRVVLSLAGLGGVVLVGRGGNFILGPKRGFHIRIIAPKEQRVNNLVKYRDMSQADANAEVMRADSERRGLIDKLFDADIDDPRHYDLILNLAWIDMERMVEPTVTAINSKFERLAAENG